jgi:hypothetical protein
VTAIGLPRSLLALGAFLLALGVVGAVALAQQEHRTVFVIALMQSAVYALAAWIVLRLPSLDSRATRRAVAAIIAVALLLRLLLLPAQPVSTDLWRYIWDGRVQAAGINPYLHVPLADALQGLRDETVFSQINRADYAPTIYPPAAQLVFYLVTRLGETAIVMKAAMVAFEAVALWAMLQLLAARGLPRTRILLYAWHPLAVWEFAGSAHVDAAAIAFLMLAFVAADRRAPFLAGVALAAGAFVKYFPGAAGPALWRPWDWRLPTAFVLTALALYAPYLSAGWNVLGFLPGYVAEEGFAKGSGFFLWLLFGGALPAGAAAFYLPAAAALMAVLALWTLMRRQAQGADLAGAMVLAIAFVVLTSPHYPWYFAWLIPFLCFVPLAAVIYLTGAATALYFASWPPTLLEHGLLYGPFAILLLAERVWRRSSLREVDDGRAVPA